jgi:hypothetical protein
MTEVTRHEPGSFCWPELATTDPAGAKKFYAGLFGWTANDQPAGPDMVYSILQLGGRDAGALYELEKAQQERGVPPHWNTYVSVESADDAAKKARELGAKVIAGPFDVMEAGRMAILQDPTGAVFCVWQAKNNIGARVINEPGALCWSELDTNDTDSAERFYTKLFGWTTKVSPEYTEFDRGSTPIGGMMRIPKEWGDVPPNWLPYFAVSDCDATAAKAKELGGSVTVPPTDIPNVGPFAVLQDPQGAVFAVYRLTVPA